jgi:hypothetical protein
MFPFSAEVDRGFRGLVQTFTDPARNCSPFDDVGAGVLTGSE